MHPVSSGDSPHRWAAWAEADSNGDSNSSDHGNRQRPASVLAQYQPVLPDNTAGLAFIPVEFEGMQATPYVDSSRCTGEDSNGDSNSNDQRQAAATGNSA